jgi:surface antigen
MGNRLLIVAVAGLPLLGACATNEQTGGLIGALGGAAGGAAIGGAVSHRGSGALIGAGLGALGGYMIGSAIGRALDERDRQFAAQATQQVLYEPVPAYYYEEAPPPYGAPPPPPRHRRAAAPPPAARWSSDHSGARGSATVVAVQREPSGGECRTVREVAYVSGQELKQDQRFCRNPSGEWQKA